MAIRFWAYHPDIASRPVHVTLTSPCGVLFDEDLTSDKSMSLGMVLPEGQRTLDATVRVSRTWSPADAGEADTRQLGVAFIRGLQGPDPAHPKVIATPKHFAVHSGPQAGRDGFDVDRLPLTDGRFQLRFGLSDQAGDHLYHWLDDAYRFLVYPDGRERGILRLEGSWRTEEIDSAAEMRTR